MNQLGHVIAPERFYKYRPFKTEEDIERARQIICDGELFAAPPSSFNDPFDCRPVFTHGVITKETMRLDWMRMQKNHDPALNRAQRRADARQLFADPRRDPRRRAVVARIQNDHNEYITNKTGVVSLSTISDDILMWAHYAAAHSGICIGFNGLSTTFAPAQKVLYSKHRVPINPYLDDNDVSLEKSLLTKSDHWEYEQEYRLIRVDGPGKVILLRNDVTEVILGVNVSGATAATIRHWIQERSPLIALYQARVDDVDFAIRIEPVKIKRW